jgi:hypothetical protein
MIDQEMKKGTVEEIGDTTVEIKKIIHSCWGIICLLKEYELTHWRLIFFEKTMLVNIWRKSCFDNYMTNEMEENVVIDGYLDV